MGLRIKIIAALLSILLGLAIAGTLAFQRELERSYLDREHAEAVADLRRLLVALESRFLELDAILRSWSNWTALYEHAQTRNLEFSQSELSFASLRNASIDWLMLIDQAGQLIELVEVPQSNGSTPLTSSLGEDSGMSAFAALASSEKMNSCGIVQTSTNLSFSCFRPLYLSSGEGPVHGTLVIGRWIETSALAAVRNQTKLDFSIAANKLPPSPSSAPHLIDTPFGDGKPEVSEFPDRLEVRFPISTIIGRPAGTLTLNWPRSARIELLETMRDGQLLLILIIMVTGGLMLFVIDRLVVHRLQRLHNELANISQNKRWTDHVTSAGKDEIAELATFINSHLDLIHSQVHELHNLSMTDTLTGLPNRRRFDEQLNRALGQHQRTKRPLALALFDVDCFKKYNDTYGHPAGDAALVHVAKSLRRSAQRPTDLPARIGGEEFAILFEDTDLNGARECAETARQLLIEAAVEHRANTAAPIMTISCGVAIACDSDSPDTLYSRADMALYAAKEQGRNRVAVETPQGTA